MVESESYLSVKDTSEFVLSLDKVQNKDAPLVGGKAASLGELISFDMQVPSGFVISAAAYKHFTETNNLQGKINKELEKIKRVDDRDALASAGAEIRKLIKNGNMPPELSEEISKAYCNLANEYNNQNLLVAVRSSATTEDMPNASFAGQHDSYLNIKGDSLLSKVIACFTSLYNDRAIAYRIQKGIPHKQALQSVVVQRMIDAKAAGVIFTLDPVTGDNTKIVIEGVQGLGESLVAGAITPDYFCVNRSTLDIIDKRIVAKEQEKGQCISDKEVIELARQAIKIEQHYGTYVDIEWAVDKQSKFPENVWILQSRPETTWASSQTHKTR